MEALEGNPLLTEARSRSFKLSAAKTKKYFIKFLHNDWVSAAYALAPDNRAPALERMLEAYELRRKMSAIVKCIKERVKHRSDGVEATAAAKVPPSQDDSERGHSLSRRPNAFSSRHQASPSASETVFDDAWELWNAEEGARFLENEKESVLQYWKRMSKISDLQPLARVARDLLGMAASSTSVERLFSQAGLMVTKKGGIFLRKCWSSRPR